MASVWHAPVGIFQSNRKELLRANPALAQMFGYESPEAMLASAASLESLFAKPDERRGVIDTASASSQYLEKEIEYRRRNGSTFTGRLRTRAVHTAEGDLRYFEGFVEDITERKLAQQKAVAALSYSQTLLTNSPIGIVTFHANGQVVSANPAVAQMMGAQREALLAQNVWQLDSWNRSGLLELAQRALKSGQPQKAEIRHLSTFGKEVWVSVHFVPFEYQGEPHLLGQFVDFTEHKGTEESLREMQRFAQSTLDSLSANIAILDHTGRILAVNRSWRVFAEANCGTRNAVCEGANYLDTCDHVVGEDAPSARVFADGIRAVLEGRQARFTMEYTCNSPSEQRWFIGRVRRFVGEDPVRVVVAHENITERKLAQQALRENEEKFSQLADHANLIFWVRDLRASKILYVSPAYERVWGRSCESLYEHGEFFMEAIHPEDRMRMAAVFEQRKRGQADEQQYRIVQPDGSVRWIHSRSFTVRNEHGEPYRMCGISEDVTERWELEQQLRQAQKMEAIGQLAGGVAHDFNNILAATLMQLGLLQQDPNMTRGAREDLKEVERHVVRAANLTRQLLLFSRRQIARVEPLDLNVLIQDLLKMLRRILVENVALEFHPAPGPAFLKADAGMLEQVVMNLCVNARDAMPKGGRLTITTAAVERSAAAPKIHPEARPGRFVCLSVADNGCGMTEAVLKRIFEPFFTTKEVGKGTGLGLASVHGIVKQHDGWVEVESAVGHGSTFRVYLPSLPATAPGPQVTPGEQQVRGGSECILLVEDDPDVRRNAVLCLQKLGYRVLEALNGRDALKVWHEHQADIQLLFTDMVMPEEITGLELAQQLKAAKPSLKVIICSGYSADLLDVKSLGQDMVFLGKPFSAVEIAKLVRKGLDNQAARLV